MDRLAPVIPPERIWILTNEHLRETIVGSFRRSPPNRFWPSRRSATRLPPSAWRRRFSRSIDPDAVMGVFPSDHVIGKLPGYRAVVRAAFKGAAAGRLMVVGIEPRWAETGYGYIEFPRGTKAGGRQALPVLRFHEKPEPAKARRYLAAGNYYWNSGMFFWRAGVLLEELAPPPAQDRHPPGVPAAIRRSAISSPG